VSVVGGVPRLVFSAFTLEELQDEVEEACVTQANKSGLRTLEALLRQNVLAMEDNDVVHRVLRILPDDEFGKPEFVLGSEFVRDVLVKHLSEKRGDVVSTFLRSNNALFPVSRGIVFEGHALQALELGGAFRVRPLVPEGKPKRAVLSWDFSSTCPCSGLLINSVVLVTDTRALLS
jgi:hypothetical protein